VSIRVVQLGSARTPGEGLRIGTVRRPPRGVPKSEFGRRDFYDVWLPTLSPTAALLAAGQQARDDRAWRIFVRRFSSEMGRPEAARDLDLLAALSHTTNLSVGCYCQDEKRCHRGVLRELLLARGAELI
jgi:uncharacterized protein YeaO (DUF488 family)